LQSEGLRGVDPRTRLTQVPPASGAEQVSHPLVQAVSQQRPSTQWWDEHSLSQAQVAPIASSEPFAPQPGGPSALPASPSGTPPSVGGVIFMSAWRSAPPSLLMGLPPPWLPQPPTAPARTAIAKMVRNDFI